LGPDNGPVGLCRLQFGGETLRPDGLLGVILPSFILLAKKLANKLLGALQDVREGRALRNWRNQKKRRHFTEKKRRN